MLLVYSLCHRRVIWRRTIHQSSKYIIIYFNYHQLEMVSLRTQVYTLQVESIYVHVLKELSIPARLLYVSLIPPNHLILWHYNLLHSMSRLSPVVCIVCSSCFWICCWKYPISFAKACVVDLASVLLWCRWKIGRSMWRVGGWIYQLSFFSNLCWSLFLSIDAANTIRGKVSSQN